MTNIPRLTKPILHIALGSVLVFSFLLAPLAPVLAGVRADTLHDTRWSIKERIKIPVNDEEINTGADLPSDQKIKPRPQNFAPDQVLVKFKPHQINLQTASGRAAADTFSAGGGLAKKEYLQSANVAVLLIKDGKTVEEKIAELANHPKVEYAEPNFRRYPAIINTNDTSRDMLWGLDNTGQKVNGSYGVPDADIDAPEAWTLYDNVSASPVIVAVIDTGVAFNHPDLASNMWDGTACKKENGAPLGGCMHGYDFEVNDKIPLPADSSHGTHVAGTIAAAINNGKGIIGVAPKSKIMALKFNFYVYTEIKAIDFAIQNGAKVINASYGGEDYSQSEYDAISRFKNANGIFAAAAGNDYQNNDNYHSYPSDYNLENIISVAATDQSDQLAYFSNWGPTSVDVGAPGNDILSTVAESSIYFENFNSLTSPDVPAGWVKSGYWGSRNDSGDLRLYGDYLNIPYANNTNELVTSSTINLGGANGAVIEFLSHCDTEYSQYAWLDYMELEASGDGYKFYRLGRWDEYLLDDDYTGDNPSPVRVVHADISHTVFRTSNFKFRIRWYTNDSNYPVQNYDGCWVDDITISKISDGSNERYDYYSGTSMATPHVAGLAALLMSYNPSLSSSRVKDIILKTGDELPALKGRTVSGRRINALKSLEAASGTCFVPASGDWQVASSCSLNGSATAPKNVIIFPSAVLTIEPQAILTIDLKPYKLLVKKGGGVLIKKSGAIKQKK